MIVTSLMLAILLSLFESKQIVLERLTSEATMAPKLSLVRTHTFVELVDEELHERGLSPQRFLATPRMRQHAFAERPGILATASRDLARLEASSHLAQRRRKVSRVFDADAVFCQR